MKYAILCCLVVVQVGLLFLLDHPIGSVPPLGAFFSPQHGFWQNATPVNDLTDMQQMPFPFNHLKRNIDVVFDERGVPRVFADNWNDAAFAQGYVHARDRLFQMDLLTRLAGGRLSEMVGKKALPLDQKHRLMGISEAADNMAIEILKDRNTKEVCLAYVAGINFYLANLPKSNYPVEYKLLNTAPEAWDVKKIALMYKYLAWTLSGSTSDIPLSRVKAMLDERDYMEILYPIFHMLSVPTVFSDEQDFSYVPDILAPIDVQDDAYLRFRTDGINKADLGKRISGEAEQSHRNNGSNAWAIGTEKSAQGSTILCNDPHLSLNMPSIWYELQFAVQQRDYVYGFSVPGVPFLLIGFNENMAWGITSASTDLTDYYYVDWVDKNKKTYRYEGQIYEAEYKEEIYAIKDGEPIKDTIWSTQVGHIIPQGGENHQDITIQWIGRIPSNDIKGIWGVDTSTSIPHFQEALDYIFSPGLNILYITKRDIGYRMTGAFPMKWERQGDFIMPFSDHYVWKNFIPSAHLPQTLNPAKHYIFNANQHPTDEDYPYYLGFRFPAIRSNVINQKLSKKEKLSVEDMKQMQCNNENFFAQIAVQNLLAPFIDETALSRAEKTYFEMLVQWDFVATPQQPARIYFNLWWAEVKKQVYATLFGKAASSIDLPQDVSLLELMIEVPKFEDFIQKYAQSPVTIEYIIRSSFTQAVKRIEELGANHNQKNLAYLPHYLMLSPFGRSLDAGGSKYAINALDSAHGPSMRFIVDMSERPIAYTCYPGGQSGNPGDKRYDEGVEKWASGKYNTVRLAHTPSEVLSVSKRIQFVSNVD